MARTEYATIAAIAADETLDDLDVVRRDDDSDSCVTVAELRAGQRRSLASCQRALLRVRLYCRPR
jgi:hypothetical protein